MKEGVNQEFYDNGRTKEEFLVMNGLIQGYHRKWNDKGDLVYECRYTDGKKVGEITIGDTIQFTQYVNKRETTDNIRKLIRSML